MKIGIFGGTFNPIHTGHALILNYLSQNYDFDKIWVLVNKLNPLKNIMDYTVSDSERIIMVDLVVSELDKVETSDIEFKLSFPSYTINTLTYLTENYPHDEFTLLIGSDNWKDFTKWKDYKIILENYNLIIYPRPGYEIKGILPKNVILAENCPQIEISSTDIRTLIKQHKNISFYVPENVKNYIQNHKLYL